MQDFSPYKTADRKEATKNMYLLTQELKKDLGEQGREDESLSGYNDRINAAYTLSNKSSFRKATVVGKKIAEGIELARNEPKNGGEDLAKCIAYLLLNEPDHEWRHVRSLVEKIGAPFTRLLELPQLSPAQRLARKQLRGIAAGQRPTADSLREIADLIEGKV